MTKKRSTKSKQPKKAPVSRSRKSVAPRQPRVRKKSTALAAPTEKPTTLIRLVRKEKERTLSTRPIMLLVLGPHRSGTSVAARLLECLGAENSLNCLPPAPDNPTGFFEDADIYRFSQSVLMPLLHRHWSHITPVDWSRLSKADRSRLGLQALEILRRNYPPGRPLSVLKQPRINDTLPFWLSLLEHAGFDVRIVCVVRDPVSVARSLATRNGFPIAHTGMLYLSNWLAVLPHLQERSVAFLQFDEIFASPGKALRSVAQRLSLPLPPDFDERIHDFTAQHLQDSLRHSSLPQEDVALEPDLPPLVAELYRTLVQAAQAQNVRKTSKFAAHTSELLRGISPLFESFDAMLDPSGSRNPAPKKDAPTPAPAAATPAEGARLASLEADHSSLSALHCTLAAEHSELVTRHTSLVTEREALQSAHSDLAARHTSLVAAFKELEEQHAALSTTHAAVVQEREALATRHAALATTLEELQGQHASLSTLHPSLLAERDNLAAALQELQDKHTSLVAAREADSASQQELATRHSSLVTELETLRSEHSALVTRHSSLVTSHDDLVARHSPLVTAFEKLEGEHAALIAERDKLLASSKDTADENELLLQQLHQVQEELEKYFLRNKDLQQQADRLADAEKKRQTLEKAQAELENSLKQSATRAGTLEKDRREIAHQLAETQKEKGFVLGQLQQVQEEIEHYFHENRRLRRRVLAGGEAESLLQAEAVTLGSMENTAPHLHLNYTLERAHFGSKDMGRLRLRLVEHHGRPGLAILRSPGEEPPLERWRVTGEEEGSTYQLVVPQDEQGEDFISSASAGDLIFLREAARMLAAHLSERDEQGRHTAWRRTAQHFVDHLHDKIRHLTFGAVTCTAAAEPDQLDFSITPALLGHHTWASLAGSWKPGALVLRAPVDGTPPLSSWPRDAAGRLVEEVEFRPGQNPQAPERHEFWRSFTARDRLVLDALAASLPRLAARLPGGDQQASARQPAMDEFSARLQAEWRALDPAPARKKSGLFRR